MEEKEEKEESTNTMKCVPSSKSTIAFLSKKQSKRHDEEMNKVTQELINSKLKKPTTR